MLVGAGRAGEGERTVMAVLAGAGVGVGDCGQVQGRVETTGSVGTPPPPPRHCHSLFHLFGWRQGEREQRTAVSSSAANRLIGEVVQSRRRPLLGPSPG